MPVHRQAARKKGRLTVTAEQPCGVQVVEWVGLVAKYFSDHYDSSSKTY
jgi:hypothetical protein